MNNTIFISIKGGVIQSINVTDDLDSIKAVVIDFDVQGIEDSTLNLVDGQWAVIFNYGVEKIADGDVEHFEGIVKKGTKG